MTRCKAANSAKTGNTLRMPPAAWRIVGDAQRGRDRRMKRIDEMAEIDGTAQRRMKVAETISTRQCDGMEKPASSNATSGQRACHAPGSAGSATGARGGTAVTALERMQCHGGGLLRRHRLDARAADRA